MNWKSIARCLQHAPVGAFNAWLFIWGIHLGWAFLIVFLIYELNEDWRIKDKAYIDIFGWLWGFAFFVITRLLLMYSISQIVIGTTV